MEYYLALDLGEFYSLNKRYIKIPLMIGNTLESIISFTTNFSKKELKEYIKERCPKLKRLMHYDLVIVSENFYTRKWLATREYKDYFALDNLYHIIVNNIYTSFFDALLINYFPANKKERHAIEELIKARYDNLELYIIEERVINFLNAVCYNKGKLNFEKLHNLAMIVGNLHYTEEKNKELKRVK